MKNIVILISGRGSNMRAIVEAGLPDSRVVAVISNRADAPGLVWAREQGIFTEVVDHKQYADREAFDAALAQVIDRHAPDLVVLAGFMRILTTGFVERYAGRMLNVHPSLLPAFTGVNTHARAIEAGVKLAGCTVHFVTPELDHGPIVAQAAVPVLDDDTPQTLSARVLAEEHRLYPQAVRWFVEGRLRVEANRVFLD
ncbi:formyltetrahydrofolate-dependent phosphoribosylglycinamide formyltransferase [Formivibrio citricus]|uniref:Phosphoribosylglycinamide formyltransferase n=1 Tax=Formivibrio citricus TaxID=83765 RepID=A0A1I4WSL7_9NEIS|nr:phosphoribosylglycinamide formyltransferase [Formivibrio citricus]SFN16447.1 formyltetrahydrofolate-dependent phosphoribosylglycinamide formyltransferase [Formivibrio citricus]